MREEHHVSRSPSDTWTLARAIVEATHGGLVIALHGDLGSGKTCFVQGLAAALGIRRPITSPTFTVINEYRGSRPLHHVDLYRLHSPDEALAIGFEDYLHSDGITAVEWAERAGDLIPSSAIHVRFELLPDSEMRQITVRWPEQVVVSGLGE